MLSLLLTFPSFAEPDFRKSSDSPAIEAARNRRIRETTNHVLGKRCPHKPRSRLDRQLNYRHVLGRSWSDALNPARR
jgi:hypothetical protein